MSADRQQIELEVDVLVVGSGFSGSLTATILQQHGFRTALLDRTHHPRFAVGESSTPTSNLLLRDLALKHGFDWLLPFCKFGPWTRTYPELVCGLKRGFGYVAQSAGREFVPRADHANELMVAASASDETSDTQWLRSDIDGFLFEQARKAGVQCYEDTALERLEQPTGWDVRGRSRETDLKIRAAFLIDATGSTELLVKHLQLAADASQLQTRSRSLFGHFAGLPRWQDIIEESQPLASSRHPFRCDDATLHHVLDEGWMWWIRFHNDVTSVGFVLDAERFPLTDEPVEAEWSRLLARYPQLEAAIAKAQRLSSIGLKRTPRLQRYVPELAGRNWALMPHTAGFIDPLHSTGIAMSLAGVDRITSALLCRDDQRQRVDLLKRYEEQTLTELRLVDLIVSGAYRAIRQGSFRKFAAYAMTYFAAVTTWERRQVQSLEGTSALFLADDSGFRETVRTLHALIETASETDFERQCEQALRPYNHVGLFRPPVPNMYAATAVPESPR